MENDQTPNPYDAVLADLRAQKERIDTTIALLESLRTGGASAPVARSSAAQPQPKETGKDMGPGAFLGMNIPDATKKLLEMNRRPMQTTEIVRELERGGLMLTSIDKVNTVGSTLLRRFYTLGDIVRVNRGVWGLQEWYPGRKFPGAKVKVDNGEKDSGERSEAQDVGNGSGTNPDIEDLRGDLSPEDLWGDGK